MKHISKFLAILLTAALLTGCGAADLSKYGSTVAATYGDQTLYLDEANFWLRLEELSYSYIAQIYKSYYGITDFWGASSGRRTQTFAETVKEDVMAEFLQIYILLDHAGDYDVTLTDEDNKKIDDYIAKLKTNYGTSLFTEDVIGSFSDEQLRASLVRQVQALKVWNGVREQAVTSVTDEECKSFTLNYFIVSSSSSFTDPETKVTITGEALAKELSDRWKSGLTLDQMKELFSGITNSTVSFARDDEENGERALYKFGKDLKDGEIVLEEYETTASSGTVTKSWYVIECASADDPDAALKVREEKIDAQKEAYFNSVYEEWKKSAKSFSVKSAYNDLTLTSD